MSIPQTITGDFHVDLKALLPRLRIYALSLTRDRDRADDLVQDAVVKALAGQRSFQPGTNFPAWLFRIQRNEFISGLRRQRPTVPLDDVIANTLSHAPAQESGLIMREFTKAFEAQSAAAQKQFATLVNSAAQNAPAGSEQAVAMMKGAMTAANTAFESVQKAVKQATDMAETNLAAVTQTAAPKAAKTK
mgnify:CR=1 FL=1